MLGIRPLHAGARCAARCSCDPLRTAVTWWWGYTWAPACGWSPRTRRRRCWTRSCGKGARRSPVQRGLMPRWSASGPLCRWGSWGAAMWPGQDCRSCPHAHASEQTLTGTRVQHVPCVEPAKRHAAGLMPSSPLQHRQSPSHSPHQPPTGLRPAGRGRGAAAAAAGPRVWRGEPPSRGQARPGRMQNRVMLGLTSHEARVWRPGEGGS